MRLERLNPRIKGKTSYGASARQRTTNCEDAPRE